MSKLLPCIALVGTFQSQAFFPRSKATKGLLVFRNWGCNENNPPETWPVKKRSEGAVGNAVMAGWLGGLGAPEKGALSQFQGVRGGFCQGTKKS